MRSHRCNVICHLYLLANMVLSRFMTNKCMNEYQRELYNKQRQKLATEPVVFLTFIKPHFVEPTSFRRCTITVVGRSLCGQCTEM